MKIKYNKSTLTKLEQLFKDLEYTIRYEKGQFKSGYCLIHQKNIIVINKFYDTKGRIESLLDILNEITYSIENLPSALKNFVNLIESQKLQQELALDNT